jgi:hypothetical protein
VTTDQTITPAERVAPSVSGQRPAPSGVGGWLILVLLGAILTPLMTVYLVSVCGEFWTDPWFLALATTGGILSGWSLFAALALLNRWPDAPVLAQILLIGSWCFSTSVEVLVGATAGLDYSKTIPSIIGSAFGTVLWVAYLRQSRRVRATYGPMPPGAVKRGQARVIGLVAGILVTFLAVVLVDSRRQTWAKFQSDDGRYALEAPGTGRGSTLKNGVTEVVFGNDVRGFAVTHIVLAPENSDAESYCETVRDTIIANLKASNAKTSLVSIKGIKGIEFSATFPSSDRTGDLRGRVYRTSSEGFLLLVTGPEGGRTDSEANRFFRSFQINP